MESRRLSNFDIERNIKSVSMKRLLWIFISGFILFMIVMAYEGDRLPFKRGIGRLVGLLLIVVAVYFSIESTRMALSAETINININ